MRNEAKHYFYYTSFRLVQSIRRLTVLDCTPVSCRCDSSSRRNNRYIDATLKSSDAALNAEKCFGVFARSSARQSGDREHTRARAYMCVRVHFFLFLVSLPISPPLPSRFSHGRGTRRGRFISTPVAIVPFVSQPALHASRRRAFSFHLLYLSASHRLSFSSLPSSLSPLLFMVDPRGGRIDSTLSRHIREYTFNARRRRIYSPVYFPHFDEWRTTSHATSLNVVSSAWFFASNKRDGLPFLGKNSAHYLCNIFS